MQQFVRVCTLMDECKQNREPYSVKLVRKNGG